MSARRPSTREAVACRLRRAAWGLSRRVPIIVVLGFAASLGAFAANPLEAQSRRTMTSERQVWDTSPLDVEIDYGAGRLELGPADSPTLYRMELEYDERAVEPTIEFNEARRTLRLGVRSVEGRGRRNVREGSSSSILLTREVPLDLDLEFGAGRAEIELGGLSLRNLTLATGASETRVSFGSTNVIAADQVRISAGAADLRVLGLGNARAREIRFMGGVGATVLDFGGAWSQDATASVEMGVGSVTLRLPRELGVRINRSSFLTSFTAPGMERDGNSYLTSNWGSALRHLTIDLSAALGSIQIEWID